MKKYFYYVFKYKQFNASRAAYCGSGVCESSEDGLFPAYQATNDCIYKIRNNPERDYGDNLIDASAIHITNVIEIPEKDFLMFNYDEVNGNDKEK